MAGNGWKWLTLARPGWTCLDIAGHDHKWLERAEQLLSWQKIMGNCWKGLADYNDDDDDNDNDVDYDDDDDKADYNNDDKDEDDDDNVDDDDESNGIALWEFWLSLV